LAIENIWIIDSNSGICIFDWYHETKEKTIDEQLVSGLLLAFRNFSSEAGLVDISAIEGIDRKLAYKADDRFIIASICHSKDFEPLIEKTLLGLLEDFKRKYKELLDSGATTDVSPFRTFDEDIIEKLEGTTSSRTAVSTLVGSIISMAIIAVAFITYAFTIGPLAASVPDGGHIIGLIILLVGFITAGFFGGLVAGGRRLGIIASFISVIPVFAIFYGFYSGDWTSVTQKIFYALLYFLLFSVFALSGGVIGGYSKEKRFLYPMTELLENEMVSEVED